MAGALGHQSIEIAYRFDDIDFEGELIDIIKLFHTSAEITEAPGPSCQEAGGTNGYNVWVSSVDEAGVFLSGRLIDGAAGCFYILGLHKQFAPLTNRNMPAGEYKIPLAGGIPQRHETDTRKNFKREVRRGIYTLLSEHTGKKLPWGMLTGIRPAKIVHEMLEEGLGKDAVMTRLDEYYKVSDAKAGLLFDVACAEKSILDSSVSNEVSLYIGIPFCPTRCLYCSFTSNSISACKGIVRPYLDALKREIEYAGFELRNMGLRLQNLYIGGGTPTSIDAALLKDLLDYIDATLDLGAVREYTVEAGRPDSLGRDKLNAIRESAANRISINPQSMNESTLRLIGREHTPEDIITAFHSARELGFANINMDVIAGLPGENADMFRHTMEKVRELCPESLTVHTLAVKRASRLKQEGFDLQGPENLKLLDTESDPATGQSEPEITKMIEMAAEYARSMRMHPYYLYRQKNMMGNLENVGYCKPGCESIYNIQIMEEKQTVIAVGAGAVTKVVFPAENRIERAFNVKNVDEYIKRIDEMILRKKSLLAQAHSNTC